MNHTRVKICGITSAADAETVANCGADAIGLVFYPPSSRAIATHTAAEIARAAGPFVTSVGLFVNPSAQQVDEVLARVPVQLLQFHGDESPAFCAQFQRPYVKALRVKATTTPEQTRAEIVANVEAYADAAGILLDTYSDKTAGGSGERFDWDCVPRAGRWILAGGLTVENVGEGVTSLQPYAVDVSTGVESAPGKKDPALVRQFIEQVRAADARRVDNPDT